MIIYSLPLCGFRWHLSHHQQHFPFDYHYLKDRTKYQINYESSDSESNLLTCIMGWRLTVSVFFFFFSLTTFVNRVKGNLFVTFITWWKDSWLPYFSHTAPSLRADRIQRTLVLAITSVSLQMSSRIPICSCAFFWQMAFFGGGGGLRYSVPSH